MNNEFYDVDAIALAKKLLNKFLIREIINYF